MAGYSPYGPGPYPYYPTYGSIGYGYWFAFIVVLFILLLVLGGGYYYYNSFRR
ncbi:sporulation protein YjcZ [Bacillus weihaiensis]|uniref:sporulation protein YjcZ n=1 Tax=Bacillus weihaiensis TaxID=1547283 RepID=UPI0011AB6F49|nr:sporulation protein YjcZ [Bacillus weihaiensis]